VPSMCDNVPVNVVHSHRSANFARMRKHLPQILTNAKQKISS
jgi:hypothetical protein